MPIQVMPPPAATATATASEAVFARLRTDIVAGAIEPQARLGMKALMQRYQVGMSPLREALNRLAGEGFVQFFGQRGFKVPPISLADLEDLSALRDVIERTALEQALTHGDDAWGARIVGAFHGLELQIGRFGRGDEASIARYDAAHRAFHLAMFQGAASPRTVTLWSTLFDQGYRYRKLLHHEPTRPAVVLKEHRHLMQRLLARDLPAATEALCHHLTITRDAGRRHFAQQAAAR